MRQNIRKIFPMIDKLKELSDFLKQLSQNDGFIQATNETKKCLTKSIDKGGTVLVCGNGGSATQASHMVGELVGRFAFDRPPLPAVSLFDLAASTAVGNDYGYDEIFSRFVDGLGKENDILFSISTSGNSMNCLKAMESAKRKKMVNIALLGKDGGSMKELADTAIVVPTRGTPAIQEIHLMVIHWLCEEIEKYFFKAKNDKDQRR